MKVLALDLGGLTGFATADLGSQGWVLLDRGTWRLGTGGQRYRKLQNCLDNAKPDAIFWEDVRGHTGTAAAQVYGGYRAIMQAWCEARGVPYQGVVPSALKKFATGKGTATKEAMIRAAKEKFGLTPGDDNEADALWVLEWARKQIVKERTP